MINLLAETTKKALRKEYYHRLVITILFMFVALFTIALVLLVPSYFLTLEKTDLQKERVREVAQREEFRENQELSGVIESTREKLAILADVDIYPISTHAIDPLLTHLETSQLPIILYQIVYQNNEDTGRVLGAQGVAATREDLLAFVERLRSDYRFESVEVPVSNLVQNTDVDFQVTIGLIEAPVAPEVADSTEPSSQ